MPPISKPEQRFKENTGERFMQDGRIRCHALAKSKVRQWREDFNDNETPTDELWPECQCGRSAVDGQYVCRWHGGKTPRSVSPPRTILDSMPLEMAEQYRVIMDSPDYISRKEDINLIQVRRNMLLDDLKKEADSEEVWGLIREAVVKLEKGDTLNALDYLKRAETTHDNKAEVWNEIYKVEKLLGDMTTTQMKTAKDLQSMATVEQVNALVSSLINFIHLGAREYIPDAMGRSQFLNLVVAEMQKLMGTTPQKMIINAEYTDS